MCCLIYNLLSSGSPSYLAGDLIERAAVVGRFVRRPFRELVVPFCTSNVFLIATATSSWNGLPDSVKRAASLPIFKRLLYEFLLNSQSAAQVVS